MNNKHSVQVWRNLAGVLFCFLKIFFFLFDWFFRHGCTIWRTWVQTRHFPLESCGARFLAPLPCNAPLSFAPIRTGSNLLPRPGLDQKKSKFFGPDLGPTRLYFPRTGPDGSNLASTWNQQVSDYNKHVITPCNEV